MPSTKASDPKNPGTQKRPPIKPKPLPAGGRRAFPILLALAVALGAGLILAAGGFAFAAQQESHDPFCASCHTQPESTFFARSTDGQQADLASYHTSQQTRCIDCHSGTGVTGRMDAELLGARNAVHWYTHTAVQPAQQTVPVSDENCLKCHQDVTASRGRNNHFHYFLKQWQSADPKAAGCVNCHPAHATTAPATDAYLTAERVQPVCQACHRVAGGGD